MIASYLGTCGEGMRIRERFMARTHLAMFALAVVCVFQACGNKPVTPPAPAPPMNEPETPRELDIGDVESALAFEGRVASESRGANVSISDLEGRDKIIAMSTVTVQPPYPAELWVEYTLRSSIGFPARPVAVRGAILRNVGGQDTALGRFSAVLGADAHLPGAPVQKFRVNALEGLATPPESMLLHVAAELLLLPAGTGPNTVDPETAATLPEDASSALSSNPVRIEFKAGSGS